MSIATGVVGLLTVPFSFYGGWLLYNHVQATDLMWFVWWVSSFGSILTISMSAFIKPKG